MNEGDSIFVCHRNQWKPGTYAGKSVPKWMGQVSMHVVRLTAEHGWVEVEVRDADEIRTPDEHVRVTLTQ